MLSGTTCPDGEGRKRDWPSIDGVEPRLDGSHLTELHQKRARTTRPTAPTSSSASCSTACGPASTAVEEGHDAVNAFRIEVPLASISAPALLVCGTDDWAAYPEQDKLAAYLPGCQRIEIPGGGVPLVDHMPEAFAAAVLPFLADPSVGLIWVRQVPATAARESNR